MNTHNNNND